VTASIIWPNTRIGQHAEVDGAILARNCHVGRYVTLRAPVVLGDKTVLTDYTRI
jgi:NDP-sugar pyrophosphorylase family protein